MDSLLSKRSHPRDPSGRPCSPKGCHPAPVLAYFFALLVCALVFRELTSFLLFGLILLALARSLASLRVAGKVFGFSLLFGLPLLLINLILSQSLFSAAIMWLRLFFVLLLFSLLEPALCGAQVVSFLSSLMPQSALLLTLTMLLIPTLKKRLADARRAMRARGYKEACVSFRRRIESALPLLRLLLWAALEESWCKAEALHARAYASGPRQSYWERSLLPGDLLLLILSISSLLIVLWEVLTATAVEASREHAFALSTAEAALFLMLLIGPLCLGKSLCRSRALTCGRAG